MKFDEFNVFLSVEEFKEILRVETSIKNIDEYLCNIIDLGEYEINDYYEKITILKKRKLYLITSKIEGFEKALSKLNLDKSNLEDDLGFDVEKGYYTGF